LIDSTFRSNIRGKGFLWLERRRQKECKEIIGTIRNSLSQLTDEYDSIKQVVKRAWDNLEYAYNSPIDDICIEESSEVIFTLALENISKKLMDADENTRMWNKGERTQYYMSQIKVMIDQDYKSSSERAKKYYNKLVNAFKQRKRNIIASLNNELNSIQSPELIKVEIERLNIVISDLKHFQQVFTKTINKQNIER